MTSNCTNCGNDYGTLPGWKQEIESWTLPLPNGSRIKAIFCPWCGDKISRSYRTIVQSAVLDCATDLESRVRQMAALRSVDATESARWLDSVAQKLRELVSQDTEAGVASPPGEGEAKRIVERFGAGEPETLNGFAEKYGLQILVKERSQSL